jgi:carbon-monoxide dehydrogenase small subunit/xanthine dehydrogenase small subunit
MTVNGRRRQVRVPPMTRLLDVLRDDCGLTGTKEGCGEGECGACTVLLDGTPVDACLVPAAHAHGAAVTTIEGVSRRPAGRVLQRQFEAHGAAQCGICTPGMIVASLAVRRGASATEVATALAGNLCRCTGYASILRAVAAARARPSRPRPLASAARGSPAAAPAAAGPKGRRGRRA